MNFHETGREKGRARREKEHRMRGRIRKKKKENLFHTTGMKDYGISSLKRLQMMWDQTLWMRCVLPKHSNAFNNFIVYLKS